MPAISSVGTQFVLPSAGGVTNTVSGIITAMSLSGVSCAEIDVTSLASTTKSYVLGTRDGGTIDITVNVDQGSSPDMPTAGDAIPTLFKLRFGPNGGGGPQFEFNAYIQSVSVEASVDQQVIANYTLRLTGSITAS
jgi:hypothetical protein